MPRYLCLQRPIPADSGAQPSPAQMRAMYEQFDAWRAQFRDSLPDAGGRLGASRLIRKQPVTDGPFVEIKDLVGGYMIVSAANLEDAVAIAVACPGLVHEGSAVEVIEIREG
jgi:hypothetical protein